MRAEGKAAGTTLEDLDRQSVFHPFTSIQDHLASVAFWYQAEPHAPFPPLPSDGEMALPAAGAPP